MTIAEQMQQQRLKQRKADNEVLDTLKRQDEERLAERIVASLKLSGYIEGKVTWTEVSLAEVTAKVEKLLRSLALRMGFEMRPEILDELRQEAICQAIVGVKVKEGEKVSDMKVFAVATSQAFYGWINRLKVEVNGGRMEDADPYGFAESPLTMEETLFLSDLENSELAERVFARPKVTDLDRKTHWTRNEGTAWDGTVWADPQEVTEFSLVGETL